MLVSRDPQISEDQSYRERARLGSSDTCLARHEATHLTLRPGEGESTLRLSPACTEVLSTPEVPDPQHVWLPGRASRDGAGPPEPAGQWSLRRAGLCRRSRPIPEVRRRRRRAKAGTGLGCGVWKMWRPRLGLRERWWCGRSRLGC